MNIIMESIFEPLLEMANISKTKYDIPCNIWISTETQNKHLPRVKVQQDYGNKINYNNFCSISISQNPQILAGEWKLNNKDKQDIFDFIVKNYTALMSIWRGEQAFLEIV